jgi:hypothetical protein
MKDDERIDELPALMSIFDGFTEDTIDDPLHWNKRDGHEKDRQERLAKLRTQAGNCPACILAVLRQRNVSVGPDSFDWKK